MAVDPDPFVIRPFSPGLIRAVGIASITFFGFGGLALAIRKPPSIALTPSGVGATSPAKSYVPWEAIASVGAIRVAAEPVIALRLSAPDQAELSPVGRILMRANRSFGGDLIYSVRTLAVDPALLYFALGFYLTHPRSRHELGTQASVMRIEAGELPADPE